MYFNSIVDDANSANEELTLIRPGRTNKTDECYDCEEVIPSERVQALPGVERCLACQRQLERRGLGRVKAS